MDKSAYESRIYKNGSEVVEHTCDIGFGSKDTSLGTLSATSPYIFLSKNDYVELQMYHDYSGLQEISTANTFLQVRMIE